MQLFALDDQGQLITAKEAEKQQDYFCVECNTIVHLRFGWMRQPHFFHLRPHHHCRQSNKTIFHLQTQKYIFNKLPPKQCVLEQRFQEIQRIADVVWIPKKVIFEVQCSPISIDEINQRNQDYSSLGYQVVWILHELRYNKYRCTQAEMFLDHYPVYYTNIDKHGQGYIYDQYKLIHKGYQKKITVRMPIEIHQINHLLKIDKAPQKILSRLSVWPYYFKNDLTDLCKNNPSYSERLVHLEQREKTGKPKRIKDLVFRFLIKPYLSIFKFFLEKAC